MHFLTGFCLENKLNFLKENDQSQDLYLCGLQVAKKAFIG